jgi:hypothetical protein
MRRVFTFALALIVLGLTSIDPVFCPDGCTSEQHQELSVAPLLEVDCGICHGVSPAVVLAPLAPVERARFREMLAMPQPLAVSPHRVDRPPRSV